MKQHPNPRFARVVAPLLCAGTFLSTPAFAQDAQPAPQAVVTPPQSATVAPPPVVRTVPDTPPEAATAQPEPTAAPVRSVSRAPVRRVPAPVSVSRPAPAPVAAPAAPVAAAPAPEPVSAPAPAPETAAPAQPVAADTNATRSTTTTTAVPLWAWVGGGIAAIAILLAGLFALRRRRADEDYYAEPYVEEYVEPIAVEPMPVAAVAPKKAAASRARAKAAAIEPMAVAPDEVHVVDPEAAEVAELTAATAPVAERPWLEFAMRPVRAGTNVDEALVEIELTVGNAGSATAKDVRISTFLLSGDPKGTEMERLLTNPPADATTDPVSIAPGEGKRIDATLALLKSDMGEKLPASFRPIVVADARYTLEDGTEGRTAASFEIGVTPEEGNGLDPIDLDRASMHDNVAAELHGEPVHA